MGRHAMLEGDVVLPAPRASQPALRPLPQPTPGPGFPRPRIVPPGYDAPPAGLDRPLDGPAVTWAPALAPASLAAPVTTRPAPRRRGATVATVLGALGAGVAVLATGGTALGTLVSTTAATPSVARPSATAKQCSDTVADLLDETADALGTGGRSTWASTVSNRSSSVAATYGRDSAEYAAFTAGADEIVDWLTDPTAAESYGAVVDRIVPSIVATCDRAYR